MSIKTGDKVILRESFAFCGLGWETGTVLTVTALEVPFLPDYILCKGGTQNIELATPTALVESAGDLPRRRRRRTKVVTEPIRRRRVKRE